MNAGHQPAVHLQGEHIFNALDALALELADTLTNLINPGGEQAVRAAAVQAIQTLTQTATNLGLSRNNQEFRTATRGDPRNTSRYSGMAVDIRRVVRNVCNGASAVTEAYTKLNRYMDDIAHYAVDELARATKRGDLHQNRRNLFDAWYSTTYDLLYDTLKALRDAALAVARTLA